MTISMKIKNDFGDLEALSPQLWKFNEKEPGLFDHHFPFISCQWFFLSKINGACINLAPFHPTQGG